MCTITLRASSLPELFDCPARWEAKYVRGLRLPKSGAAQLGTAVHAGTALYDQSRIDGSALTADEAAGAVADAIHHPEEDVEWGDDSPSEAERIGIALHTLYCRDIAPAQHYVAVEATCEALHITDIGLTLTGTTDRVTLTDEGYGIADLKTGRSAVAEDGTVSTGKHAAQIAVYELLAGQALGTVMAAPARIIGLQVAKTDKGRRAGVGIVRDARALLIGDEESPGLLHMAADMLHAGRFWGNPSSQLCNPKFCPAYPTCRWRR